MVDQGSGQDRKLTAFQRQQEALRMRAAGKSHDVIAAALGYASRSGAHKAVTSAMKKCQAEGVAEMRALELDRLERLQQALWDRAIVRGDTKAITTILAIMARRSALLGLDAPERKELTGAAGGPIEVEDARAEILGQLCKILDKGPATGVLDGSHN